MGNITILPNDNPKKTNNPTMATRQGITATTRLVGTTRTRPRPWASNNKLRSIATRTLAVAASLWSPSPPHNGPLSSVAAFRLETPHNIGTKYPRAASAILGEKKHYCFHHKSPSSFCVPFHRHGARRSLVSMTQSTEDEPTISSIESTSHLPRLFVQLPGQQEASTTVPLRKNSLVPLTADQEHYLLDVMRITNPKRWGKKTTDGADYTGCVRIFNGSDGEWLAKVVVSEDAPTNKKQSRRKRGSGNDPSTTVLECLHQLRPQPASSPLQIDLCLGYIRDKQRRRFVFEKATELGVNSIQILETDFCVNEAASYKKKKDLVWEEEEREKHEKHVVEAAEQCERLTVPVVGNGVWSVDTLVKEVILDNSNKNDIWLVCRERSEESPPIISFLEEQATTAASTIHVLVGPEGGWSPRELEIFSSVPAVQFVSLGSSVLRAETAAITAVATIQMHQETKSE